MHIVYIPPYYPTVYFSPVGRESAQAAGGLVGCGGWVRRSYTYFPSCGSFLFFPRVFLLSFTYLVSLRVMSCFFFFA